MLIKEYRILLPLTTEEYRIAQLFMIQKKSRLESSGAGSGVEIIKNEPYEDGNCGNDSGQYTYKIYHIGNRIPMWIRNVLPSSALEAHEEAWNSYPYTRTRYSCPLISHFSVEVETRYLDDAGQSENVFNLSQDELKHRNIDVIDFVKDPISSHDYIVEEDPKLYKSLKTGRGPLNDNWVEEFIRQGKPVMCAYKLCKVEFKYWGLQTRAERWIHELALRNTMLRAHRQAWAWQDEWFGLTIEQIRLLEDETQKYLSTLMSTTSSAGDEKGTSMVEYPRNGLILNDKSVDRDKVEGNEENENCEEEDSISSSNSDDIFFDCTDKVAEDAANKAHKPTLVRWSSELLVNEDELEKSPPRTPRPSNKSLLILVFHGDLFPKTSADSKITDIKTFRSTLESLIGSHFSQLKNRLHVQCVTCGSELGQLAQLLNGLCSSSFGLFHPSLGPILASDSPNFTEAVNSTVLNANRIVANFLASDEGKLLENEGPISISTENEDYEIFVVGDFIGGILMYEALARTAALRLEIGGGNNNKGERALTPASLQSSPALNRGGGDGTTSHQSLSAGPTAPGSGSGQIFNFKNKTPNQILQQNKEAEFVKNNSAPPSATPSGQNSFNTSLFPSSTSTKRRQSQSSIETFSFRPSTAFLLGCPLAFVLIQKKLIEIQQNLSLACDQLFNLYYTLDLCAARLEPVLNPNLALLPAPKVPRYQRFHLISGPGADHHDLTQNWDNALLETPMIWGNRRVDHELYSPPEMSSLPALALPSILHASYWESKDVGAFIIRQFLRFDEIPCPILTLKNMIDQPPLQFQMPLTVWNRRRTRFKIANLAANHRANDVIVVDGGEEQLINARFCYGPMDLVVLSQENVLVYILPAGGEWFLRGVETTDKNGRLTINLGKTLPIGIHHVRLIVQGDHTFLSVSMAIVPPGTPIVVFSIDGSLTASVSVTGRDPRLRPGAVDVVRFWQQQGYLIIYLTARLDMQQRLVSTWLATHNFPHGLLFFTPSLSTEPLRQKMQFMKHLADIGLCIQAAYGSAKDVAVYANAGLNAERIFKVGGHHRRRQTGNNCVSLDNGYSTHLHDLHSGRVEIAQPAAFINPFSSTAQSIHFGGASLDETTTIEQKIGQNSQPTRNPPIQRTLSFGPRTGKYYCSKKISQTSVISSNY